MLTAIEPFKTLFYSPSFHGVNKNQLGDACRKVWQTYYAAEERIPQQVLDTNRENKDRIYVKMFARAAWNFTETLYFLYHCIWVVGNCLYHKPIKIPSGHHEETLRVERPQHDLVTDMELELSTLSLFQAYTKLLAETGNVATHKIKILPLPEGRESDIEFLVRQAGYDFCKKRDEIKAEIRERPSRWGRGGSPPQTKRLQD